MPKPEPDSIEAILANTEHWDEEDVRKEALIAAYNLGMRATVGTLLSVGVINDNCNPQDDIYPLCEYGAEL
jgi:hypothetical protein